MFFYCILFSIIVIGASIDCYTPVDTKKNIKTNLNMENIILEKESSPSNLRYKTINENENQNANVKKDKLFFSIIMDSLKSFDKNETDIKESKINNIVIDKNELRKLNIYDCYYLYMKKLKKRHKVSFQEYVEYWWDTEETTEELTKRVCISIFGQFL
jgi:hypothetical protein